jgi:hypothetical protein
MPRGGIRPGSGRPKGARTCHAPQEAKEDIRDYARKYGHQAIDVLTRAMNGKDVPYSARVAANALLDRGYGKPAQATEEPDPKTIEGIVIEPLRKYHGNGSDEPVKLEDFRSLK